MSIRRAAQIAQTSPENWGHVERGYQPQGKGQPPRRVIAPAPTIARMAYAVGLSAERLETEGGRPDAASVLREILRKEDKAGALQAIDDIAATMKPPGHYQAIDVDPEDVRVIQAKLRDDPQLAEALVGLMRVLLDEGGQGHAQDEQDPRPHPNGDGQAAL